MISGQHKKDSVLLFSIVLTLLGAWLPGCSGPTEPQAAKPRPTEQAVPEAPEPSPDLTLEAEHGSRQEPNLLAEETSPYLLMHAYNPVDWRPWNEQTLALARSENKPIFLSIGYSSCHWCHVMERESFLDEEIAELLNKNFICIKVDREERPDVDAIYMESLQVLNQLMKNWLSV